MAEKTVNFTSRVAVKGEFDVIVAGGGVAGVAAALTARREGKRVLIIEKSNILGGLATLGMVNYFVSMCNGHGVQIIKGMAEELLRLSIKYGYDSLAPEWRDGEPTEPTEERYHTKFSPYIFALAMTELLRDAGADILFDSAVSAAVTDGNLIKGVIVSNKSGLECYEAKQFIDTTGDGDLMVRAGVPCVTGRNFFSFFGQQITLESCAKAVETGDIRFAFKKVTGGNAMLSGKNHPEDMPLFHGTTSENVNEFIILNQLKMLENIKGDDRKSRDVVQIPLMPNFRTTRHIDGNYTLKEDDLYRHFDDSIAAICNFGKRDELYEIPFGALVNRGFPNIVTAGRSVSAEGGAWDIARVIPPAIITGQAAAYAACSVIGGDTAVYDADVKLLQEKLSAADVMIHFDDALVPKR